MGLVRGLTEQSPVGLDADHRRRMLEPHPEAGTRTVGWVVARGSGAARDVLPPGAPGHTGFSGTSAWVDLDRGRSYVLLTNRVHPIVDRHRDFQVVRREFHRHAARAAGPSGERPFPPLE